MGSLIVLMAFNYTSKFYNSRSRTIDDMMIQFLSSVADSNFMRERCIHFEKIFCMRREFFKPCFNFCAQGQVNGQVHFESRACSISYKILKVCLTILGHHALKA